MIKKIEHIGIAVKSIQHSNELFKKLFGKEHYKVEAVASEGVSTSFFMLGETKIELLEATNMDTKPIRACGMILQALPFTTSRQIDDLMDKISNMNIEQSKIFAGSIDESLKLMENMLETKADVLETGIPEFYCGCSLDKIKGVIASIGKEEAFSILEERGSIEMICEFCMEKYTLDAEEVKLLFI